MKKRNLVLINNATYQRETVSERPIRQPLRLAIDNGILTLTLLKKKFICVGKYINLVVKLYLTQYT